MLPGLSGSLCHHPCTLWLGDAVVTLVPSLALLAFSPAAENGHSSVHMDPLSSLLAQWGLGLGTLTSRAGLSHVTQVGQDPLP